MKKVPLIYLVVVLLLAGILTPLVWAETGTERYIRYGDVEIYTKVHNYSDKANEAVIFLLGLGGSADHGEFLCHPENPHMTILFDALNHGRSGDVVNITWDIYVDSIKAVMDGYEIKKAYLVGHSLGADAAMMFAAHYPDRVKKVILIDRAYYNIAELEQFNFTRSLLELLEYNPYSGLSYEDYIKYMDLVYNCDISATWVIKEKVLLLAADMSLLQPAPPDPSIPEIIAMIKMYPEMFGLTAEQVENLPDITEQNMQDTFHFTAEQAAAFAGVNHRFDVVFTPYPHVMIIDENCRDHVRHYVLEYIKHGLK